jgi:acetyl esterase
MKVRAEPHPAYEALWAALRAEGIAPGNPTAMPIAEARAANARYYAAIAGEGPAVATVTELRLPGPGKPLPARLYHPGGEAPLPVVVYFHGGGYALNGLDSHDRVMRELALASGWAVLGVAYSRAPEARFPTQIAEVATALDWLNRHAPDHRLDPLRFALAGDSAGAHLALTSAIARRDQGAPPPLALLLAYGMYQRTTETASHRRFGGGGHGLTSARMQWFWDHFLPDGAVVPPLAEPLHADLRGLPPVHLVVADLDCLRDDSLALQERLVEQGVPVRIDQFSGTLHSFLQFSRILPPARRAIAAMADSLRCCLRDDGAQTWAARMKGPDHGTGIDHTAEASAPDPRF